MLQLPPTILLQGLECMIEYVGERRAQVIAFLMGTHPRVGADSAIRCLNVDVIRLIILEASDLSRI
jgi:hypothetical protein